MTDARNQPSQTTVKTAMTRARRARFWLNRHSTAVTVIAVAMLVGSLAYIVTMGNSRGTSAQTKGYYLDLNTGRLYVADNEQFAPIEAPSGPLMQGRDFTDKPAGVRAYVFACYDCDAASERFIGWLEMYTGEARQQLTDSGVYVDESTGMDTWDPVDVLERGRLIREVESNEWVRRASPAGYRLMTRAIETCGKGKQPAVACHPPEPTK